MWWPNSLSFRCDALETNTFHAATCRIRTYLFTADFKTIFLEFLREKKKHTINIPYGYTVLGLQIFYITKNAEYKSLSIVKRHLLKCTMV